jgi:hypothetical protein
VCGLTHVPRPAASAAIWQTRFNCRVVIGSSGSRLGNSQPFDRHCSHYALSSSSSCGESMACRSLRPLPCSTPISMRLESNR